MKRNLEFRVIIVFIISLSLLLLLPSIIQCNDENITVIEDEVSPETTTDGGNELEAVDMCSENGRIDSFLHETDEEMTKTLFEWCTKDKLCSSLYYQQSKPNIAIFSYFVKDLIHEKTLFYPMKNMLCNGRKKVDQITSLLYAADRSTTPPNQQQKSTSLNKITSFNVDSYSDSNKNLWLLMMTAHKKMESEYIACGTNERLSVSEDGMMVNCACSEDDDCGTEIKQTSNFIYTSIGLLIVIWFLILASNIYSVHLLVEIYKRSKRTNDAMPLMKNLIKW